MKTLQIDYIGHYPEHIPTIASWHQREWQNISPELTTQLRIELYSGYKSRPGVPSCILAHSNGIPAGSASLVVSDMDSHTHLTPWVASVYVHPSFRNQGIATQLLQHCERDALASGVKQLFLFTPDQTRFYLKRGWKLLESCVYHGKTVDIMNLDLATEAESLNESS